MCIGRWVCVGVCGWVQAHVNVCGWVGGLVCVCVWLHVFVCGVCVSGGGMMGVQWGGGLRSQLCDVRANVSGVQTREVVRVCVDTEAL